ncbi:MAG TPA: hypothetical protein VGF85_13365 [Opitutaceae bacterium]|jgi:hypothetical protein
MEEETETPAPKEKPSYVPSWVMLGFILGALFVLALPNRPKAGGTPAPSAEGPTVKPVRAAPPQITTIEAVFAAWDKYAVWSDDTTEVALWNKDTLSYSECFEVLRTADGYFFRSISRLTRPVLTHGVIDDSPLEFTETERQRREWLREVDNENLKAISDAARDSFSRPSPTPEPIRP